MSEQTDAGLVVFMLPADGYGKTVGLTCPCTCFSRVRLNGAVTAEAEKYFSCNETKRSDTKTKSDSLADSFVKPSVVSLVRILIWLTKSARSATGNDFTSRRRGLFGSR